MRIVATPPEARQALELLEESASVCNIIYLEGAARRPAGDVILADVTREDTSVVIADLKALGVQHDGAISLEEIDSQISDHAARVVAQARGMPSDAVVWEEVEQRTSENVEFSGVFVAFMVIAGLLAMVGIYQNSPILIVGAMVVGPEFGPLAGLCVALIQRRREIALRSALALAAGFPLAIATVYVTVLALRAAGIFADGFSLKQHDLSNVIASPNFLTFFVASCAGVAGMLSLSTAKSGALIGVLISVTTIPAAANVGVSAAYRDWESWRGSLGQLAINLSAIVLAGTATLAVQRVLYRRRRARHLADGHVVRPTSRVTTRSRPSSAPSRSPRR